MFWRQWILAAFLLLAGGPLRFVDAQPKQPDLSGLEKKAVELLPEKISSELELTLALVAEPGPGFHLAAQAPSRFRVSLAGESAPGLDPAFSGSHPVSSLRSELKMRLPAGILSGTLLVDATLFFCPEKATSTCLIRQYSFRQPFEIGPGPQAKSELEFTAKF